MVRAKQAVTREPVGSPGFILSKYDSFEGMPKNVTRMWERWGASDVFSSLDWYRNFYAHVGRSLGTLELNVLMSRAEEPLGIAPLMRVGPPGSGNVTALANYSLPRFRLIVNESRVSRQECASRFVQAWAVARDWSTLALYPLEAEADLKDFLSEARRRFLMTSVFEETANWTQSISDLATYKASLPTHLKAILTRKYSKAVRERDTRFAIYQSPDELSRAVTEFVQVYLSSWKAPEPFEGFIPGLIDSLAKKQIVRIGVLYLDNLAAAAQIWFVERGIAYIYKLAYDNAHYQYSPGTLLTMHLIEHVVTNDSVTKIDYLTGDDAYKKDWMSTRNVQFRLRICTPYTRIGCAAGVVDKMRIWKDRIQKRRTAKNVRSMVCQK